ncbi:MAG TPA: sugar phosphate isomerase/epimerase family protein [Tepidisphaeraceae bacterium]|jgi:sugar phosphate isomerase/epimerase
MPTLPLGLIVGLSEKVEDAFRAVTDVGLHAVQLACWNPNILSREMADEVKRISQKLKISISSVWTGYTGPCVWNFTEGPSTIGLAPPQHRAHRSAELKKGADFAAWIGAPSITTHAGFIPEDPNDPNYKTLVPVLRDIAEHCAKNRVDFWFETGQETPVTLLRTIEDIGLKNIGINLDPANLILYGKANPIDALDVFGKYVKGVHAKDGVYPTNGRELGHEMALGQGKVNFPVFMPKLKSLGFTGAVIIEREISGPKQVEDIKQAIKLLTPML